MPRGVGRYSGYLRPLSYVMDITIIILVSGYMLDLAPHYLGFSVYVSLIWIFTTHKTGFYEVYRFTTPIKILSLLGVQLLLFALIIFSFYGFFMEFSQDRETILKYCALTFTAIGMLKFGIFYFLKSYRTVLGGNFRRVVILGKTAYTEQLATFFKNNPDYGYKIIQLYDALDTQTSLEEVYASIIEKGVDEVYCSLSSFDNEIIREITDFTDNNLKILKFIPDNTEVFTKKLNYQYLGITPVLALREIPIDTPLNQFIKRSFDILMSLAVLIGILSWLTPILAILIKLESKGPVFFKQKRNGLDYEEFFCYKFRSMRPNPTADLHQVRKNDVRITRVGRFLRKTSIDEMPQFINVLLGDMSVVGPRPHMVSHTHMYAERIDKFMVRHFIKPGITGLAQVSGFRGEVEDDDHIINRVKFDIFYVENWSLLLDIKIIIQTVIKAIKGDERAY